MGAAMPSAAAGDLPGINAAALISAVNVSQHFGEGDARTQILFDVCIDIVPGQLVIMTGPSGSGKTTLLTLLGALRSGQSGRLHVLGRDLIGLGDVGLTEMRRNIGFIFQLHNLIDSLTAISNVMMSTNLTDVPKDEARKNGVALLERLGLGHRIDYKPASLSGGQRQRVAVARALVNRPKLILADEPTAALDGKSSLEVVTILQERALADGASILMVTHDNRILDKADRIVSMVDGRIVSDVMVKEQVLICEMLRKIEFFASLGTAELSQVAGKMQARKFHKGEVLARQGEMGDQFFLLREGEVDVMVSDNQGERRVATLDAGRYFGERSLITGDVRNATVVGSGAGIAYTLAKPEFDAALSATPTLKEQLQKAYFSR
jgi:putative ABC transport system ATP-binding protein